MAGTIWGFPDGSTSRESACSAGDSVRSLGWEDPLKEAMATHSSILCLENFMDREAWQATVHGVIQTSTNAT